LGRAADAQKRVPTTTCLHLRERGLGSLTTRHSSLRTALGRAADAQKRVPTTTCLPVRARGTSPNQFTTSTAFFQATQRTMPPSELPSAGRHAMAFRCGTARWNTVATLFHGGPCRTRRPASMPCALPIYAPIGLP
jgi:hypothetical protein